MFFYVVDRNTLFFFFIATENARIIYDLSESSIRSSIYCVKIENFPIFLKIDEEEIVKELIGKRYIPFLDVSISTMNFCFRRESKSRTNAPCRRSGNSAVGNCGTVSSPRWCSAVENRALSGSPRWWTADVSLAHAECRWAHVRKGSGPWTSTRSCPATCNAKIDTRLAAHSL